MDWTNQALSWYIYIALLGILMYPSVRKLFHLFPDNGYAFSKTIAILIISYASFVLGGFKIIPFTRQNLLIITTIIGIIGLLSVLINRKKNSGDSHNRFALPLIIFEELLFIAAFFSWTYIRSQEPSIRSLEKFMDFGFINSILRSSYFPPKDMWYSSHPINYYYFGHLTGAFLIKLTGIKPSIGYNLILSTLFALGITQTFSFCVALIMHYMHSLSKTAIGIKKFLKIILIGTLGSFMLNLGGNLHTIYLFTKGYQNDNPIPFWKILAPFNPLKYWYPNATRFIPFTIHEFPSYSYVVADLHGHVFDIPFVLLTLSLLWIFIVTVKQKFAKRTIMSTPYLLYKPILFGFLTGIHYMTNAFDGPIYMLLSIIVFFAVYGFSARWIISCLITIFSFVVFSIPFSRFFIPFVNGIGVNCSAEFLTRIGRIGPFLFEKGNCQITPPWMMFVLWGFFWINFILFGATQLFSKRIRATDIFILILFTFGTLLIIIPEFFYIKDIYPAHFRANTMFKLGYQSFIIMSIASVFTFFRIKLLQKKISILLSLIFIFFFSFVAVYPLFSIPSYYGNLAQKPQLDGSLWLKTQFPEDREMIDYLNTYEPGQPVILEAQGDSYTEYERISAFTGLPTVAGWWVHEWLWRGSSNVIAERIPDVIMLYESPDSLQTKQLIQKYHIRYVIIGRMEKQKYPNLNEKKFSSLGRQVFRSKNGFGALYRVDF